MAAAFGTLLRAHRRQHGLTQEQLAGLSGLSAQAISTLERGTRSTPRRDTVNAIVAALGLDDTEADELRRAAVRSSATASDRTIAPGPADVFDGPPRWLPPAVSDFVGRGAELARLVGLLRRAPDSANLVIATVEGMGGVGKTSLAVAAAHQVADAFPDGQIYLDLRGFGPGEPLAPLDALDQLLTSLGRVAGRHASVEHASGRYRTALAGRRILVVLDNASGPEQVQPLLAGTGGSAAIITSRRSLAAVPAADHTVLDVLAEDDGIALLTSMVGADRAMAEPKATVDVVRRCGKLPLAIRIAGARLASRPQRPIRSLADQLADQQQRLNHLEGRNAGVRASFATSLSILHHSSDKVDHDAARAFPLLGLLGEPRISLPVAARLIDRTEGDTERILERLVDSHLMGSSGVDRFRLHDLLQSYAADQAVSTLSAEMRAAALRRVLILYNTVAWRELARSSPTHLRLRYRDAAWIDEAVDRHTADLGLAWLTAERTCLVAVLTEASHHAHVPPDLVTQVARAALNHLNINGLWSQLLLVNRIALAVAFRSGDTASQAFAHHDLGAALTQLDRAEEAVAELETAARLFADLHDRPGEAMVLCNLAHTYEVTGRLDDGIETGLRALALCADRDTPHLEATTLLALGLLYGRAGDRARELEYHERSLAIYVALGHERGVAFAMYTLGIVRRNAGRAAEAAETLRAAIELTEAQGLRVTAAESRTELANLYVATNRPDLALGPVHEALEIAIQIGSEITEAHSRHCLGDALEALGRPLEARREWRAAQVLYERLESASAGALRSRLAGSGS